MMDRYLNGKFARSFFAGSSRSEARKSGHSGQQRGFSPLLVGLVAVVLLLVGTSSPPAGAEDPSLTVLPAVATDTGIAQDPAQVAEQISAEAKAKQLGKESGLFVMDASTGQVLFDQNGAEPLIPASNEKIPTAVGVLSAYDANDRLTTRVTQVGQTLYLIGAGDPLLASRKPPNSATEPQYPALTSMKALVRDTAAAIAATDAGEFDIKYDASLFTGPDWGPDWPEYFRTSGIVSPVSALIVDDGSLDGKWGAKVADPAEEAGSRFAQMLKQAGVSVGEVSAGKSPAEATEVASVTSVPIYEIVGQTLTTSDNDTAEMLFRLAGVKAGYGGSFSGGARAVQEGLAEIGVSSDGMTFADGSGLSRENRVSAQLLAQILRRAVNSQDGLWSLASGLAVGGATGTLRYRFDDQLTSDGGGWVRGKTGTLNYVSSLGGFVQSKSGRVLVFGAIANEAKSSFDASTKIDQLVAKLAECGCPGSDR
jgi:D-alanyl-D-alanine carboxypeptidase/D-alanyl-D-alanine-endopeptidase (penicillin-binding protein 4)